MTGTLRLHFHLRFLEQELMRYDIGIFFQKGLFVFNSPKFKIIFGIKYTVFTTLE